ncbi:MAG: hypothetical protein ACYCVU_04835 [Gammaproteobacteria bacterium]
MRIAKEARAFKSFESFAYAVKQVVSVCRQNEGWLRSTQKPPAAAADRYRPVNFARSFRRLAHCEEGDSGRAARGDSRKGTTGRWRGSTEEPCVRRAAVGAFQYRAGE